MREENAHMFAMRDHEVEAVKQSPRKWSRRSRRSIAKVLFKRRLMA